MAAPSTPTPTTVYRGQQGLGPITHSYDPKLVAWIKQAAAATGADPAALLATSLQESGATLNGPAGDGGTSFGPFQFHRGGALANHTPAWASTYDAVLNRATEFARGGVHHGKGAAAVQRPQDQQLYAKGVDAYLAEAHRILAHLEGKAGVTTPDPSVVAAPGRTPADHQAAADGADIGKAILEGLTAVHENAQLAHLPGSSVTPTGSILQDLMNANAQLAGVTAPTLPVSMKPTAPTPTPSVPAAHTRQPQATSPLPASPLGAPGGGWGGSLSLANAMRAIGARNGLSVMSAKRERMHTASGGVSDHWTGSKTAFAYDLSNGTKPTPQMDATAAQIANALGALGQWKAQGSAGVLNVNKGGYRYQMLYRTTVGGNHFNHVHIGVKKL